MSTFFKPFLTVVAIWLIVGHVGAMQLGAFGRERPADDIVREVVSQTESQIRMEYPGKIASIEPLTYTSQVVSGTNFLVKARVTDTAGEQSIVHLYIHEPLFKPPKFQAMKTQVDGQTPLSMFWESDVRRHSA